MPTIMTFLVLVKITLIDRHINVGSAQTSVEMRNKWRNRCHVYKIQRDGSPNFLFVYCQKEAVQLRLDNDQFLWQGVYSDAISVRCIPCGYCQNRLGFARFLGVLLFRDADFTRTRLVPTTCGCVGRHILAVTCGSVAGLTVLSRLKPDQQVGREYGLSYVRGLQEPHDRIIMLQCDFKTHACPRVRSSTRWRNTPVLGAFSS